MRPRLQGGEPGLGPGVWPWGRVVFLNSFKFKKPPRWAREGGLQVEESLCKEPQGP